MSSDLNNQRKYGNRPDGYPKNNKAFNKAAQKVFDARKEDAKQAEIFLEELEQSLRKTND